MNSIVLQCVPIHQAPCRFPEFLEHRYYGFLSEKLPTSVSRNQTLYDGLSLKKQVIKAGEVKRKLSPFPPPPPPIHHLCLSHSMNAILDIQEHAPSYGQKYPPTPPAFQLQPMKWQAITGAALSAMKGPPLLGRMSSPRLSSTPQAFMFQGTVSRK